MRDVVITHAVRTPVGRVGGALREYDSQDLTSRVFRALIERSGVDPSSVDYVLMGQTKPSTRPMNVARCGWLAAGLPDSVPAASLYRACCSGSQSIYDACLMIETGCADIIVAGGVDSLSQSVYSLRYVRDGIGTQSPVLHDGLTENGPGHAPASIYGDVTQGASAEYVAEHYGVSREDQDILSVNSHKRAVEAIRSGRFKEQIVPVDGFDTDEHPRETSLEALAKLKPSFMAGGVVTAGNSSGRNDAASCVLLMSRDRAEQLGIKPELRHIASATTALDPTLMLMGPVDAVPKALQKAGLALHDIDLIEFNEAFASQTIACLRILAEKDGTETYDTLIERTNVNGSGISIGHPPGATGSILTTKLLYEMKLRSEARFGMVTMCVGGGHGFASIWERVDGGGEA